MPTYLSPGVYVEEAQSGSRPIEGVGTAVAAFVGFAEKGPFHEPTLVTNWSQYVQTFGEFVDGTYLGLSVYSYFANGGGIAYVVRVGGAAGNGQSAEGVAPKELTADEPVGLGSFRVSALPYVDASRTTVEVSHPEGENAEGDPQRKTPRGTFRRQRQAAAAARGVIGVTG